MSYVYGVSTRAVDDLVKTMGMSGISRSQVSRLCTEIYEKVGAFLAARSRRLRRVCVSTVSIVGGREGDLLAGTRRPNGTTSQTAWGAGGGDGPDSGSMVADAADRGDGVFERCTHPDDPASGAALTSEGDVDAQYPQERLGATQAAGERAGIFGPPGVCSRNAGIGESGPGAQKIRSASSPGAARGHDLLHAARHRVGVDDVLDRGPAICLVGAHEGASGPERGFTRRGPDGKVGHPRQPVQAHARQGPQAVRRGVKQGAQDARPRAARIRARAQPRSAVAAPQSAPRSEKWRGRRDPPG